MKIPGSSDVRTTTRRRGFSLLEVVLVVGLTAVIVTMVASAIDFHLRQLTVRKTRIDEAQVARAILRQIADDLRSVVVDRPIDFSAIQNATQNVAGAAVGGTTGAATGASATGASTSGAVGSTVGQSTGSSSLDDPTSSDSTMTDLPPGVYGTNYEIQIDVSRVPRYEEYAVIDDYAQSGMIRMLSDVKTITYFVTDARVSGGNPTVGELPTGPNFGGRNQVNDPYGISGSIGLPPDTPIAGLARRVNDRAEVRYATATGDDSQMNQRAELIAPEVVYVEFTYFDGTQWQTAWDMQEMGGIPLAVEVNLFLGTQDELDSSRENVSANDTSTTSSGISYDPEHWYHMVVYLPVSETLSTESSTTDASSTDTSSGNASSSGGTQ